MKAKVLLIDIETSPLEVYTWNLYPENIGINQILKDWSILSFAARWLDSDETIYESTRHKRNPRDDKQLVAKVGKLLNEADIVISHYGSKFDIPKIDTRRLYHNLPLFPMPKHEDTKTMANKFAFTSNKLEYIGKYLKIQNQKLTTVRKFQGMELWRGCLDGNSAAWDEMQKYNIRDIDALEEVYYKLAPRASKINYNVYQADGDAQICVCGSTEFYKKGFYHTNTAKFQCYRCKSCGKQHRTSLLAGEKVANNKRSKSRMPC